MDKVQTVIDKTVQCFLKSICEDYNLPLDTIEKRWTHYFQPDLVTTEKENDVSTVLPPLKKKIQKKSSYQNFFVLQRLKLKQENPQLNFGELSTTISKMWGSLTKEEQMKYSVEEETVAPDENKMSCMKPKTTSFRVEELNKKKMSDLREICEKLGIRRTGNKTELIRAIVALDLPNIESGGPLQGGSSARVTLPCSETEAEPLEVETMKNIVKRADIEDILDNPESEEEDFNFEEDNDFEENDHVYDDEDEI